MKADTYERPLFGLSQRLPPQNPQAEQALLGALLANNRAFDQVVDILEPHHFADQVHALVFEAIRTRLVDGHTADPLTLKQECDANPVLAAAGGSAYLATLLGAMISVRHVTEYARVIVDAWTRRQLIAVGEGIVNLAFDGDSSVDAKRQIEAAEAALTTLRTDDAAGVKLVAGGAAIAQAIRRADAISRGEPSGRLLTGMPTIDKAWMALPGTLTLLAGPPGSGKTGVAVQIGKSVAKLAHRRAVEGGMTPQAAYRVPGVSIYSLEMSAEQLGFRMAAEEAEIDVTDLMEGRLDFVAAERLLRVERETAHLPIRIHDASSFPIRLLLQRIRLDFQRQPELLVIVDHLLAATEEDSKNRAGSRDGGVNAGSVNSLAQACRRLAEHLRIPLLVLAHTSRPQRGVDVRRPTMADVSYGGERAATGVVFLHRPIMFMDSQPPAQRKNETDMAFRGPDGRLTKWHHKINAARNRAEIVVAKQTHGRTDVYPMRWNGSTTSLREWDENTGDTAAPVDEPPDWV